MNELLRANAVREAPVSQYVQNPLDKGSFPKSFVVLIVHRHLHVAHHGLV